ncbi:hypothetical protein P4O66_011040 [Electrophorus voltai]|uniref:alpha-N-acetylgalactosaminide alpha-2,6-sialyltransferase n=1 Tax=Electrophorus voltai TaxID=2609070 RepID=A0AAD8Z7Q0_9TELE|nr:hypothetical protein P4O66_011040 [Electrophorus voltai]
MQKVSLHVIFLLCCILLYVVIWKKIPGKWVSFQKVYNSTLNSRILWGNGYGTTEEVTEAILTESINMSSRQNVISIAKEVLDTLHQDKMHHSAISSSYKHTENRTVLPLLYKHYFTKMPKWDFEDVYIQNSNERLVCSKSLHNSKDKTFQAAVIQNIQLWLHKGLLNISEWNRLAHFNNPFGFMGYNYTDIKPSVDLIPKPMSYQLLPVPESADDGCIRCAVVGTGGILNGSKMGKEIDSHPYVIRVNGAVIKGYEEDVGSRTSVYVHTSFSLEQSTYLLRTRGFKNAPSDEGIKYLMIPEGLRDFEWIQGLINKKRLSKGLYSGLRPIDFYSGWFKEDRFYVLHPDFLRYVRNRFLQSKGLDKDYWHNYRPTNGAFAIFLALHTCDIVNVYGFITEDYDKYSNYYYETTKNKVIFYINHDYNLEIKTWKKLHESGIINLYQRN